MNVDWQKTKIEKKEKMALQVLKSAGIFKSNFIRKWGNEYKLGQDVRYFTELSLLLKNNIAQLFFLSSFFKKKVASGDLWNIFSDFLSKRRQKVLNNGQISS